MLLKDKIKHSILPTINHYLPFNLFSKIMNNRKLVFLLFHRIDNQQNRWHLNPNVSLEISSNTLEATIKYFKEHNYQAITIDSALKLINNKTLDDNYVIYTFDDGYKDNFNLALPVFEKYDVPFTVYIATDFINKQLILWWYVLEDILMSNEMISFLIESDTYRYSLKTIKEKEIAFNKISQIIRKKLLYNNELIESLLYNYKSDLYEFTNELMMDWGEVIQLSKHPLSTIGLHGKRHIPYSILSETQRSEDITESITLLEDKLNYKVKHFAYPFGQKDDICINGIADFNEMGIISAMTTVNGFLTANSLNNASIIPRIEVSGINENNLCRYLNFQLTGLMPKLKKIYSFIK